MVDQRPRYDRAGGAAGADAGRVMDSTAWTVGAAPIVLFGSASRGEIVDDRELDLLVVADPRHGRTVAPGIRAARPRRSAPARPMRASSTMRCATARFSEA